MAKASTLKRVEAQGNRKVDDIVSSARKHAAAERRSGSSESWRRLVENQTAKTAKVLFMGQATVSNPRKLGMANRISLTIAA